MGLFSKILKAPLKLHKKALKKANKVRKKTTPGLGGGKRAKRRRAAAAGPQMKASSGGNARRAINKGMKHRKR
jgi:hypothetical protein